MLRAAPVRDRSFLPIPLCALLSKRRDCRPVVEVERLAEVPYILYFLRLPFLDRAGPRVGQYGRCDRVRIRSVRALRDRVGVRILQVVREYAVSAVSHRQITPAVGTLIKFDPGIVDEVIEVVLTYALEVQIQPQRIVGFQHTRNARDTHACRQRALADRDIAAEYRGAHSSIT